VESDEEEEIDDADLLGLNNIKPEKRKIKQRISTQEEKSMLEKFKRIIKISQEVEMEDVAESLKITEEQLFEKLIEWGEDLPFKIKGDLIVVENLSAFIGALDKQFEVWEERDKTKEGKI